MELFLHRSIILPPASPKTQISVPLVAPESTGLGSVPSSVHSAVQWEAGGLTSLDSHVLICKKRTNNRPHGFVGVE